MNLYHSNNIGNVAVLGHLGSGKTSVIEAMAKRAGISQQIGTISQGTTISDYDVEEIKRQSSINLSLIPDIDDLPRTLAKQPFLRSVLFNANSPDFYNNLKVISALTPMLVESDLGIESIINIWFNPTTTDTFLGLNEYDGIAWFNKESFETLLDLTISYILFTNSPALFIFNKDDYPAQLAMFRSEVLDRMKKSNYQVKIFHSALMRFGKEWNSPKAKSKSSNLP